MPSSAMAYLDESGDLGWKLDAPYGDHGSARYFVIAIAVGMNEAYRRIGKVVDNLHKSQKWTSKHEKKALVQIMDKGTLTYRRAG
ncbi:DUF3800 domain-containing protein [Massilia sp. TN1-12]|uniref:DUF3800 domain-containing protein n=1 Tax=Massilia paldalensis TaxID=3377675 RepID=UPI00384C97D7